MAWLVAWDMDSSPYFPEESLGRVKTSYTELCATDSPLCMDSGKAHFETSSQNWRMFPIDSSGVSLLTHSHHLKQPPVEENELVIVFAFQVLFPFPFFLPD